MAAQVETSDFLPNIFKHVIGKDLKPVDESSLAGKMIGFYFSAHWCGPCRQFTPVLATKYESLISEGNTNFEIIFVSADENEEEANDYFSTMPWKMVDFSAREVEETLSKKFQVRGIPSLVLVDADGNTITTEGRAIISNNVPMEVEKIKAFVEEQHAAERKAALEAEAIKTNFNFVEFFAADKHPVVDKEGQAIDPAVALKGKILGLYFSAHWCPPCRGFTPILAEKYKSLVDEQQKQFEIVFVSSDRDTASANDYFKDMPWKMLSFDDRKGKDLLARAYEISGIPSLILVNTDGSLITDDGRTALMSVEFDKLANYAEEIKRKEAELEEELKTMPDTVTVSAHEHPLKKLPTVYRGSYGCDHCGNGGKGWVYHCDDCGFDIHPACVKKLLQA